MPTKKDQKANLRFHQNQLRAAQPKKAAPAPKPAKK